MFSQKARLKILDKLLEKKLIDQKTYDRFVNIETDDWNKELVSSNKVEENDLFETEAEVFDLPFIDLRGKIIKSEVLNLIPEDTARNYQVVFFDRDRDNVKMAIIAPEDLKAREAVDFLAREKRLKTEYYLTTQSGLETVLKQYGGLKTEVEEALDVAAEKLRDGIEQDKDVVEMIKSAPISKMVSVILEYAVDGRASDIHIEPLPNETRIRYRIDGVLQTSLVLPKYVQAAVVSRIKVMANLKIDEMRLPQDGRMRLNIDGRDIDFRVSTLPLYNNEKVVLRILDTARGVETLEGLGFEGRNLEIIHENIKKPHGMFLVTGPTGSGKSTTLYAVLNILNREGVNITTLEDPVEYYLKGVNQSQVRPEIGLTFAAGLRSMLRQDPDIVMVGEIRDSETAELAIHAALTGHILLSTLHTNDAFGALPRLIDMKVEEFLLASSLNIVIAQRLARRICKECSQVVDIPDKFKENVKKEFEIMPKVYIPKELQDFKSLKFYKGRGCSRCGQTGYFGRIAFSEVLNITSEIKKMIMENKYRTIMDEFAKQGMLNLKQDGLLKAARGYTTVEEVLRATEE